MLVLCTLQNICQLLIHPCNSTWGGLTCPHPEQASGKSHMASSKSGHPESIQGPCDFCKLYSQTPYQLSYSPSSYTEHAA